MYLNGIFDLFTKENKGTIMNWFTNKFGGGSETGAPTEAPTNEDERRAAMQREKEAATKAGEPWVSVIDTQVNPADIKNGFFELDWNNEFIEQLLDAGYSGETNEDIVNAWFTTIVYQMVDEEQDVDKQPEVGYIKIVPGNKGKSEIS